MKVNGFYNVYFKSAGTGMDSRNKPVHENAQITALSNVTPDFRVNLPLKYQMIGRYKLENGLEVYSYKLANGYKVNIVPMEGSPAVVKNYVNVGSMNESANIKGISHFLEHMAFNGTNGDNGHIKLEPGDSFKKIDLVKSVLRADYTRATLNLLIDELGYHLADNQYYETLKTIL